MLRLLPLLHALVGPVDAPPAEDSAGQIVAQADNATTIAIGRATAGYLQPGDSTLNTGEYVDWYTFSGSAGQVVRATVESASFDTYLLLRGNGVSQDNDDRGDGTTHSTIEFTLPSTTTYRVGVTSYRPGETGGYSLTVNLGAAGSQSAPTPPVAQPLPGTLPAEGAVFGTLDDSDPRASNGAPTETWVMRGEAGARTIITMRSEAFDPTLLVSGPGGINIFNDDGDGIGLNSRVDFTFPHTGDYTIVASGYSAGARGNYSIDTARPSGSTPQYAAPSGGSTGTTSVATGAALTPGEAVTGALAPGDSTLNSGEFADYYTLTGAAGDGFTITLESTELDPYLMIRGPGGFTRDNDDADGTNSRLEVALPTDGTYQVVATSYAPGETGSYSLRVESGTTVQREARGRVFAVSAGITEYVDSAPLPMCAEDAVQLNATLESTGLLDRSSRVLTNRQVTVDGLRRAIADVSAQAGPDDLFLFFYSGHGVQLENAAELDGYDEALALIDGTVTDDQLDEWLGTINARMTLIVLDSCFSGGFARDLIDVPNRMGIFSSEEDVTSNVAERFAAGGYLSYFLRNGLDGAADIDPTDGIVTAGELSQYLRRQWAEHMMNEGTETTHGDVAYQNLVIDRGAVKVTDVVLHGLNGQGSAR